MMGSRHLPNASDGGQSVYAVKRVVARSPSRSPSPAVSKYLCKQLHVTCVYLWAHLAPSFKVGSLLICLNHESHDVLGMMALITLLNEIVSIVTVAIILQPAKCAWCNCCISMSTNKCSEPPTPTPVQHPGCMLQVHRSYTWLHHGTAVRVHPPLHLL